MKKSKRMRKSKRMKKRLKGEDEESEESVEKY